MEANAYEAAAGEEEVATPASNGTERENQEEGEPFVMVDTNEEALTVYRNLALADPDGEATMYVLVQFDNARSDGEDSIVGERLEQNAGENDDSVDGHNGTDDEIMRLRHYDLDLIDADDDAALLDEAPGPSGSNATDNESEDDSVFGGDESDAEERPPREDTTSFLQFLAHHEYGSGKIREAIDLLLKVFAEEPRDVLVCQKLSAWYKECGDRVNSLKYAILAAQLTAIRTSAATWDGLGDLSIQEKLLDEAASCYEKAVKKDTGNFVYHDKLINILHSLGDQPKAMRARLEAIREISSEEDEVSWPWFQKTIRTTAEYYMMLGDAEKVTSCLEILKSRSQQYGEDPTVQYQHLMALLQGKGQARVQDTVKQLSAEMKEELSGLRAFFTEQVKELQATFIQSHRETLHENQLQKQELQSLKREVELLREDQERSGRTIQAVGQRLRVFEEQKQDCTVCLNAYTEEKYPMNGPCGHSVCKDCSDLMNRLVVDPTVQTCPQCRKGFHPREKNYLAIELLRPAQKRDDLPELAFVNPGAQEEDYRPPMKRRR